MAHLPQVRHLEYWGRYDFLETTKYMTAAIGYAVGVVRKGEDMCDLCYKGLAEGNSNEFVFPKCVSVPIEEGVTDGNYEGIYVLGAGCAACYLRGTNCRLSGLKGRVAARQEDVPPPEPSPEPTPAGTPAPESSKGGTPAPTPGSGAKPAPKLQTLIPETPDLRAQGAAPVTISGHRGIKIPATATTAAEFVVQTPRGQVSFANPRMRTLNWSDPSLSAQNIATLRHQLTTMLDDMARYGINYRPGPNDFHGWRVSLSPSPVPSRNSTPKGMHSPTGNIGLGVLPSIETVYQPSEQQLQQQRRLPTPQGEYTLPAPPKLPSPAPYGFNNPAAQPRGLADNQSFSAYRDPPPVVPSSPHHPASFQNPSSQESMASTGNPVPRPSFAAQQRREQYQLPPPCRPGQPANSGYGLNAWRRDQWNDIEDFTSTVRNPDGSSVRGADFDFNAALERFPLSITEGAVRPALAAPAAAMPTAPLAPARSCSLPPATAGTRAPSVPAAVRPPNVSAAPAAKPPGVSGASAPAGAKPVGGDDISSLTSSNSATGDERRRSSSRAGSQRGSQKG